MFEEETGDMGGGQPKGDVLSAPDVTGGGSDTTKSMANTVEAATRTGTVRKILQHWFKLLSKLEGEVVFCRRMSIRQNLSFVEWEKTTVEHRTK